MLLRYSRLLAVVYSWTLPVGLIAFSMRLQQMPMQLGVVDLLPGTDRSEASVCVEEEPLERARISPAENLHSYRWTSRMATKI